MTKIKMHISKVKLPFYPPCEVKCELQNRVSTNGFESKRFACLVRRQCQLICLERPNEFLDFDLIEIFTFLYNCDFCSEALG